MLPTGLGEVVLNSRGWIVLDAFTDDLLYLFLP